MTTETTDAQRWHRIWSHRDELLRVARRRSVSMDDAEDAVHEAMLRASERPYLDDERLGAWLTTVTLRLCVDRHRQLTRDADERGHTAQAVPVPFEEAVCDRAEARWLAGRSRELPPRQAEALWLKAEELDVGQVARKMGLSYRTTESLLARARRALRRSLAGTLVLVAWLLGRGRPRTGTTVPAAGATAVTAAATLAVLGFVVPGSSAPEGGAGQGPAAGAPADAGTGGTAETREQPVPAAPRQPEQAGPETGAAPGRSGTALLELPEAVTGIPGLLGLPEATGLPELPATPGLPDISLPATPELPDPSDDAPDAPGAPADPGPVPGLGDAGDAGDAEDAVEDGAGDILPSPEASASEEPPDLP